MSEKQQLVWEKQNGFNEGNEGNGGDWYEKNYISSESAPNQEAYKKYQVEQKNVMSRREQERQSVTTETSKQLDDLQKEVTWEQVAKWTDNTWLIWRWKLTREQMYNDVNKASLDSILSSLDRNWLNKLSTDIQKSIQWNMQSNGDYYFTPFNTKDLYNTLTKDYWYKTDWWWWWNEAWALVSLIMDTKITQDRIASMPPVEKLKILVDFDKDWILDNKEWKFNAKELQSLKAIEDQETLNTVLWNLWFTTENFDQMVWNNYFSARQELRTRLASFGESKGTDFKQLLLPKDKFQESMDYILDYNSAWDAVEKLANQDPKIAEIKKEWPEVWKEIKKQSIVALLWETKWVAYTTDSIWKKVAEVTHGIIDNVSVGYANGKIWLVVWGSRNFWDRVNVAAGVSNLIPFVAITWKLKEANPWEITKLFPNAMNSSLSLTATWTANVLWVWWWLTIWLENEKTAQWIESMVKAMSKALDPVFEKVAAWASFEQSWLENNIENKQAYDRIKSMYEAMWANRAFIPTMKEWLLKAYQNDLYKNAEWFKFTNVSFWMIWPILLIWWGWEYKSQKYVHKEDTAPINEWLDSQNLKEKDISEKISSFDQASIERTKDINSKLSEIITAEDAKKLWTLSQSIHQFLNWRKDLTDVWSQFKNEPLLKNKVAFINDNIPEMDKALIIQNVAINLMKKSWIEIKWDTVSLKNNLTLKQYDEKNRRYQFFDKIFKAEIPDLLPQVQKARQEYYNKYWNLKSYEIWQIPLDWGISFSWVQSGKETWLNPYVVWHIAKFWWVDGKIKMEWSPNGLVDKLPKHILDSIIKQLEIHWHKFSSPDKYSEMKNIINNDELEI